jgi:DNA-binding NarL/FixJ family response regulator
MKRITVLLAEDHMVVREGFRKLLEAEDDIEVVGEAQTGRQAVELTRKFCPSVVVMDIAMPLLNGSGATRRIRETVPGTKVLILSAHNDDAYVDHAIASGASGFLLKQTSAHDLTRAIRTVHKGNKFFSPSIATRLRDQKTFGRSGTPPKEMSHLSARELEVLQLIAEGKANKETASELGISIKTVEKHRQNLMAKLDIHQISGLTRYAIGAGIIESSVQLTIV